MFKLKSYQEKTLEILRDYLKEARRKTPEIAFKNALDKQKKRFTVYKTYNLGDIPYVCLRLPTGGGKTVLAAYAIKETAKAYLENDFPLVLWLVPTNTIREQTLDALKRPGHPYRQALDEHFAGRVAIFDIADVTHIRPHDLNEKVCIVVGTIATLRVKDKTGRKIYSHNENFDAHFKRIQVYVPGLDKIKADEDKGKISYSFANLCYLNQPLVIMDEAHNARTKLTFDVLKRIHPACIIEFTATPNTDAKNASNVLYSVSATDLKNEEMIKLPIMLYEHQTWQVAIHDAISTRKKLAKLASHESDYIRPIVLFQAESKEKEVTVEVLKQHLIENEKIDPETIAVATGKQRELEHINLFDPDCDIEYIITVEALKEGWDCSFAYVFCSVANIRSNKDVEQLLGRVLRMPYAEKRKTQALNNAYAHVSSPLFSQAAQNLRDNLINMGFEKFEANEYLQQDTLFEEDEEDNDSFSKENPPLILTIEGEFDKERLDQFTTLNIEIEQQDNSQIIRIHGNITEEMEEQIISAVPEGQQNAVKKAIQQHVEKERNGQSDSSFRGKFLRIPRLCVWKQGELELADRDFFLHAANWNILDFPAQLSEHEFNITEDANLFEINVEGDKVVYHTSGELKQSGLNLPPVTAWTEFDLIKWIDKEIYQSDIPQLAMQEFISRILLFLQRERGYSIAALVRTKYILSDAILRKIAVYRNEAVRKGYQETLFGDSDMKIEVSLNTYTFQFAPDNYPAKPPYYKGSYRFQKHFYPVIGELKSDGEEHACAVALDRLPEIKTWVRNLSRQPFSSFWLPTSSDRFYPDFVAELNDGRILVIEYKGKHIEDTAEEQEKKRIGRLWEEKSLENTLFLWVVKQDEQGRDIYAQLANKLRE